jgi:hypothetical protein
MKKVVFIGGTSHSGSTLLDLMLSNNLSVFSVGEVHALFHPMKSHQVNPICGCGNVSCSEWHGIKDGGEKQLYETIFKRHPEIDTIIDSSKAVSWIKDQTENLKSKNIQVINLLIWKTRYEFALSLSKRGLTKPGDKLWLQYHLQYLSIAKNYKAVKTDDLVMRPHEILPIVCQQIGIDYVKNQENYWTKKHHTLFGSAASRIHLHEPESKEFKRLEKWITKNESKDISRHYDMGKYRSIYRPLKVKTNIVSESELKIESKPVFKAIQKEFNLNDIIDCQTTMPSNKDFPYKPRFGWYLKNKIKTYFRLIFKIKVDTFRT